MAKTSKEDVKVLHQLIMGGWEPTFKELKDRFYPYPDYNQLQRQKYTRLLIQRVRYGLKKDKKFFYEVDGVYKLLESSSDRLAVTRKLWRTTNGFQESTNSLLEDTAKIYPNLSRELMADIKSAFRLIHQLAADSTLRINEAIRRLEGGEEDENSDKQNIGGQEPTT